MSQWRDFTPEWAEAQNAKRGSRRAPKSGKSQGVSTHQNGEMLTQKKREAPSRSHQQVGHKYRAQKTERNGIKFPSKLEADYYDILMILQGLGKVAFFLRQVPIHLPGGTKLVVDYQVFWSDGSVTFEDTKGVETPVYKLKKREVEALYPIEIKTVTRKDVERIQLEAA